jgi:hypothetical protein
VGGGCSGGKVKGIMFITGKQKILLLSQAPRQCTLVLLVKVRWRQGETLGKPQAYAAVWTRSALFWGITQCTVVISYRRSGTTYRFHSKGLNHRTDRLSQIVGMKLLLYAEQYPKRARFSSTSRGKPEITPSVRKFRRSSDRNWSASTQNGITWKLLWCYY